MGLQGNLAWGVGRRLLYAAVVFAADEVRSPVGTKARYGSSWLVTARRVSSFHDRSVRSALTSMRQKPTAWASLVELKRLASVPPCILLLGAFWSYSRGHGSSG